jgi:hypothetical protein
MLQLGGVDVPCFMARPLLGATKCSGPASPPARPTSSALRRDQQPRSAGSSPPRTTGTFANLSAQCSPRSDARRFEREPLLVTTAR